MKTNLRILVATTSIFISAASLAHATPWQNMGPRAMGMGGAQVAIAQGPLASYWNPAGLGQRYNTSGLVAPIGAQAEFAGSVLQGANDVYDIIKKCNANLLDASCTQDNMNSALSRFGQQGNGVQAGLAGGVGVKIKKIVVFVNDFAYVGGTPEVDYVNIDVTTLATLNSNVSKLILRGGNFVEMGVGYGREIGATGLVAGANLKGILGKIGYTEISVATEDPGNGAFSNLTRNAKTSFQPGIDLGLLWDMRETFSSLPMRPRLGLVSRNINNPTFDQPDAAKLAGDRSRFSLQGQTRMGMAISPFKFWHVAADMDLTNNVTNVDGYKSRYLSLGTEVNVFNRPWINIPLRVGLQKNVEAGNSGLSYTGGFGLNFMHVVLDIGGMVSAKQTTVQSVDQSRKLPNNIGVAGQFAFMFGGTDEGARNKDK